MMLVKAPAATLVAGAFASRSGVEQQNLLASGIPRIRVADVSVVNEKTVQ
jgi:hypothetical protein